LLEVEEEVLDQLTLHKLLLVVAEQVDLELELDYQ
jgi:hypothetical protein